MSAKKNVRIDLIRLDASTQTRARMNNEHVGDLASAFESDYESVPPVTLFGSDDSGYHVGDGFHRIQAAIQLKFKEIAAVVHQGGQREALWHALGANKAHGLKRTPDEKREIVRRLLDDPEWAKMSNRAIAAHCGVSDPFVLKIRDSGANVSTCDGRSGRDGKTYPATQSDRTRGASGGSAPTRAESTLPTSPPPAPPPTNVGKCIVNGETVDDTPEADVGPQGRTPLNEVVEEYKEKAEERKAIQEEMSDEAWARGVDLYQILPADLLPGFIAEIGYYRRVESAMEDLRKRDKEAVAATRSCGPIHFRLKYGLNVKHPKKWKLCPPTNKGGCDGTGKIPILGTECKECKGRGFKVS